MTELIFGGVNPTTELAKIGARFRISGIRGRDIIGKNIQQKETDGADGALYLGRSIPPRTIEVDFSIQGRNREQLLEAIGIVNGIFSNHEILPLSFTDQAGTFYGVQSESDEDSFGEVLYKGNVAIFCADPFRYGDDVQTGGSATNTAPLTVTAATNYQALPVITVTTGAAASKVTIDVNGRALTYEAASIPGGTVIKIDGVKKEVRIGNVLKVIEVSGWFPYLVGGANKITTSVASTLNVQYRERYI